MVDWYSQMNLFRIREVLFLSLVFCAAFVLLIINNGIFWDTWVLYNQPLEVLVETFTQAGSPFVGYQHYFILEVFGVWGSRVIMCLAYLMSGLVLNATLHKLGCVNMSDRLMIITLFLLIPVNFARISVINHPSAIFYTSFFVGLYLFVLQLELQWPEKLLFRLLALVAFYFSFMVNSILVFYAVVVMVFIYFCRINDYGMLQAVKEGMRYLDFWVLPIIYYIVKSLFFVPYGNYDGYNKIGLSRVISGFKHTHEYIFNVISNLFGMKLDIITLLCLILLSLFFLMCFTRTVADEAEDKNNRSSFRKLLYIVFLACVLLYLGGYPYSIVQKTLSFLDWESRDQLLLPLGLSLFFYSVVYLSKMVFGKKVGYIVFSVIVSLCIVKNSIIYYSYLLDNIKQQAIIEEFNSNDVIRYNTSFLIEDKTGALNTLGRIYRFYEWTGFLREAFGDQKRFAVNVERYKGMEFYEKFVADSGYNMEGHLLNDPRHVIVINYGQNFQEILDKLVWAYLFSGDEFKKLKHQLIDVKVMGLLQ